MLQAVIFDFNGIIVNDEPIHFRLFRKVLAEEGITLTEEAYYARYLGFDDRGAFLAAFAENRRPLADDHLAQLIARKAQYYKNEICDHVEFFPGVANLVRALAGALPLAVASGALRNEIEMVLRAANLLDCFNAIVSAEDVARGKPEPEIFLKALAMLNSKSEKKLQAEDCLVIEDSKEGLRGARRAGMKCLAVTNSHAAELLTDAHAVVQSLETVNLEYLQKLCA
jgi:HAD superfamily hydrolase (TIGR01509 family)